MKIELTKEQYRTLVEAVAVVHSMVDEMRGCGDDEEEAERNEERHQALNALENYVLQHAPLFDSLDLVENEGGLMVSNEKLMGQVLEEIILPYDNAIFWNELEE